MEISFFKKRKILFHSCIIGLAFLTSCASIKGYERAYLNDEEMKLSNRDCQELEAYFQVIREGASGADGGKTGGGCGCN